MKHESSHRTVQFVSYASCWRSSNWTYCIVAHTNSRGNICVSPQTALCEVESFFFKILEFLLRKSAMTQVKNIRRNLHHKPPSILYSSGRSSPEELSLLPRIHCYLKQAGSVSSQALPYSSALPDPWPCDLVLGSLWFADSLARIYLVPILPLVLARQLLSRWQQLVPTLFTVCVCWFLIFNNFSMLFWTIFRRSFIPPANAASGSSNSLFICCEIAACAFAMASVSPRTTSRETRKVPVSFEPRDLRQRASSFRAYSSSIAARARNIRIRVSLTESM